ncbi:MAG: S49 family peptidase [Bacteroidales bacterium]|nr:S49 family peptidase [Bacteroidales bacterium]
MNRYFALLMLLVSQCALLFAQEPDTCAEVPVQMPLKVYHFKIEEEIAPPATMRVTKALEEAERKRCDVVIVSLNTFGGRLDDADKIRTAFLRSSVPVWAYVDNNAASAGALIALACDSIYMRSGASIGAATVVNESGEVQPDKYQSYMRSLMRTTAEAKGRRPDIAEAMVDPDVEVHSICDSGKVLTFTTTEALKYHFCEASVESLHELLSHAGVEKYDLVEQRYTFVEKVVGFLVSPGIKALLIMLIIAGIYFELQSPGVGFPLIMAVVAALLYFAPLYLEGLAAHWEILLFVVGVVLLVLELFVIPGFGVAGISGIILMVGGLTLSMVANIGFDFSHVPTLTIGTSLATVVVSITVALPLSIWLGKRLFESRFGQRIALVEEQKVSDGYTVVEQGLAQLVGQRGRAASVLRPSGKVAVGEALYDAVAQYGFVDEDEPVVVVGCEHNSLIVTKE